MPGGAGGDAAALCAQAYIGAHCKTWSAKYAQQWGHTLAQHVYPVIGAMPVGRACAGWRMKALKEHRVALTDVAQQLLADLPTLVGEGLVVSSAEDRPPQRVGRDGAGPQGGRQDRAGLPARGLKRRRALMQDWADFLS